MLIDGETNIIGKRRHRIIVSEKSLEHFRGKAAESSARNKPFAGVSVHIGIKTVLFLSLIGNRNIRVRIGQKSAERKIKRSDKKNNGQTDQQNYGRNGA